jgi:hypothetical protein
MARRLNEKKFTLEYKTTDHLGTPGTMEFYKKHEKGDM